MQQTLSSTIEYLGEGGKLGLPVVRQPQIQGADAIASTLIRKERLFLQALTGTGKSLAALSAIDATGTRAVIATATNNLVDQYVSHDLPFFSERTCLSFAKILGRSNYACQSTWARAGRKGHIEIEDASMEPSEDWFALPVSDLDIDDRELQYINKYMRCEGGKHDYGICGYQFARELIDDAQVVITSQHKLVYDLKYARAPITEGRAVIIDEGDGLPAAIASCYDEDYAEGRYRNLQNTAAKIDADEVKAHAVRQSYINWRDETTNAAEALGIPRFGDGLDYKDVYDSSQLVRTHQRRYAKAVQEFTKTVPEGSAGSVVGGLKQALNTLENEDFIIKIGRDYNDPGRHIFTASLVNTGKKTYSLFKDVESLVLMSATLMPWELLEYQVGFQAQTLELDSCLPLRENRQAFRAVAHKPPRGRMDAELREEKSSQHVDYLVDVTSGICERYNGRCLVLFSSIREMTDFHSRFSDANPFYQVINQKDFGSAGAAVERYRWHQGENVILIGTDSLMHGIDLPGMLSAVILAKSPFPRADSVGRARNEEYSGYLQGLNDRRIAQAIGRLIRNESDSGIIVLVDGTWVGRNFKDIVKPSPCKDIGR